MAQVGVYVYTPLRGEKKKKTKPPDHLLFPSKEGTQLFIKPREVLGQDHGLLHLAGPGSIHVESAGIASASFFIIRAGLQDGDQTTSTPRVCPWPCD